jgi:hypothetical protein
MNMYLGLCTGKVLSISLLLALADVQVERNEVAQFNGHDTATRAAWTMQRYLTTQSGSLKKHGGNVYGTYHANALWYGDCTETELTG